MRSSDWEFREFRGSSGDAYLINKTADKKYPKKKTAPVTQDLIME